MDRIIVSRHNAVVEFIARHLETEGLQAVISEFPAAAGPSATAKEVQLVVRADVDHSFGSSGQIVEHIRVIEDNATATDVTDRTVFGVLPPDLACLALDVYSVQFPPGKAPRGREYTLADMDAAGAYLLHWQARRLPDTSRTPFGPADGEPPIAWAEGFEFAQRSGSYLSTAEAYRYFLAGHTAGADLLAALDLLAAAQTELTQGTANARLDRRGVRRDDGKR